MYKSWEEMTVLEQYACTFSDMYKDAWGCRPRMDTSEWTVERFEQEFDSLQKIIEQENVRLEELERKSIERFEAQVAETIASGARDRTTALRWIMDASECCGDWDLLCFEYGLPYGYFNKESV